LRKKGVGHFLKKYFKLQSLQIKLMGAPLWTYSNAVRGFTKIPVRITA